MLSIILSAYKTYNSYTGNETPVKVRCLVKDLEAQLPNLPQDEKLKIEKLIATIKTAAKTEAVSLNLKKTGIEIAKAVANAVGGKLGGSLATIATHDYGESLDRRMNQRIGKAEMVAGRRRSRKTRKQQNKTSAITTAAKAGLIGWAVSISGICEIPAWGMHAVRSIVFGNRTES